MSKVEGRGPIEPPKIMSSVKCQDLTNTLSFSRVNFLLVGVIRSFSNEWLRSALTHSYYPLGDSIFLDLVKLLNSKDEL